MTHTTHNTPMHPFEAYQQRKGHYPRFRKRHIAVAVHPGYIILSSKHHDVYIPKDILIPLLMWLVPLAKKMGESFDPEAAMSDYLAAELEHENEIRRMKGEVRRKKRRGT